MLCRLIIVDDEQPIRMGLKNMVDWKSIGYELVGDFSDGSEALEYVAHHPVEVVLTDIKMNEVSGIELAEQLYRNFPDITVVFLSAYDDFEYARKAINFNVAGYLLKTASTDEILHFMKDVLERFVQKMYLKIDDNLKRDDILYKREQVADEILENKYEGAQKILEALLSADIPLSATDTVMTVFSVEANDGYEKWKYGLDGFYNAIRNFFYYFTESDTYFLCKVQNPILIIMLSDKEKDDNYVSDLENNISSMLNIGIKLNMMDKYESLCQKIQIDDILNINTQNTILVKRIISFISENIDKKLSASDVSDALNYSAEHLSRVLKKETGKTLSNYITEAKMLEAMRLFEKGLYVYEACEKVGYKSVQHFGGVFKNFTGVTPREYRTQIERKKEKE